MGMIDPYRSNGVPGFTPLPWREGNIRGGGNISHCACHVVAHIAKTELHGAAQRFV